MPSYMYGSRCMGLQYMYAVPDCWGTCMEADILKVSRSLKVGFRLDFGKTLEQVKGGCMERNVHSAQLK